MLPKVINPMEQNYLYSEKLTVIQLHKKCLGLFGNRKLMTLFARFWLVSCAAGIKSAVSNFVHMKSFFAKMSYKNKVTNTLTPKTDFSEYMSYV